LEAMKMKRNTLLISALGAAGLLAVWFFILRKTTTPATPATSTTLADALETSNTTATPATAATLNSSDSASLTSTLTSLFTGLAGSLKPSTPTATTTAAPAALPTYVKTKQADGNLWTNVLSGIQQLLPKGSNPNKPASLKPVDLAKLSTPANEPLTTASSGQAVTATGGNSNPFFVQAPVAERATGGRIGSKV